MANRVGDDPNYNGPSGEYVPPIGQRTPSLSTTGARTGYQGYHNLALLRDLLKQIVEQVNDTVEQTTTALEKYNLQILSTSLQDVQKAEWPAELGEPRDYISYDQYTAFENVDTRGARYTRKAYEDTMRGPSGTCALDIQLISVDIRSEAQRIERFLDEYLGQVTDAAEYRILEAFQDWAHMALKYVKIFFHIFEAGNEDSAQIPESDVSKLTKDQAKSFQTLFKTKLNAFNDEIIRTMDDLKRDFAFQDQFFDRFLGPSLKFRLDITPQMNDNLASGFFANQAQSANKVFTDNVVSALADQVKRNQMFEKHFNALEARFKGRNAYVAHINQLAPQGASLKNPFVEVKISGEEKAALRQFADEKKTAIAENNTFTSTHAELGGTDLDDAHPQYLLKAGDLITGEIEMGPDASIDGIKPSTHIHSGEDGSQKIPGSSIIDASLISLSVDPQEVVPVPQNLRLQYEQEHPNSSDISIKLAWDIDEAYSQSQFEVQIIRYDPIETGESCKVGHLYEYPDPGPDPSNPLTAAESDRVWLNVGDNAGYGSQALSPLIPDGAPFNYTSTTSKVVPVSDRAFMVVVSTNSGLAESPLNQVRVMLCGTSTDANDLNYRKLDEVVIGETGHAAAQGWISACATGTGQLVVPVVVDDPDEAGVRTDHHICLVSYEMNDEATEGTLSYVSALFGEYQPDPPDPDMENHGSEAGIRTEMIDENRFVTAVYTGWDSDGIAYEESGWYLYIGRLDKANPTDSFFSSITMSDTGAKKTGTANDFDVIFQLLPLNSNRIVLLYGFHKIAGPTAFTYTLSPIIQVFDIDDDIGHVKTHPAQIMPIKYPANAPWPNIARVSDDEFMFIGCQVNEDED